jgi:hypothetical protein
LLFKKFVGVLKHQRDRHGISLTPFAVDGHKKSERWHAEIRNTSYNSEIMKNQLTKQTDVDKK